MNEQSKLDEARYFYSQMAREVNNRKAFAYNLSAFLSATRSVLQYAEKEAQNKTGGKQWYESQIAASPVLGLFRDKRNMNIQSTPIKPLQHTAEKLTSTLRLTDSISVTHLDGDGAVSFQSLPSLSEAISKPPDPPPITQTEYKFADWTGHDDVIVLSRRYLDELQRVVEDAIRHDILTE